jgi:hypothetical protein
MRCLACNRNLTDLECSRKYVESGEYIDLCSGCLFTTDIPFMENEGLSHKPVEEELKEEEDGTDREI